MNQAAGLDELAAGSAWRASKLKSFKERALALGISEDPAVLKVLRSLEEHSSSLEQLGVRQKDGTQPRPWWADGEYDDERADAANDAGMSHLSQQNFRNAYEAFTDAIRLSPLKAAYHANRAAVALHLGNHAGAVEDAEQALKLNPTHVAAHLRAAKAHLALRKPVNAVLHYERALALNPAHVAAQRGLAEATTLAEQLHIDSERETAEATRGDRPPLPQHSLSDEDAAEQLLAAEAMLRLHPAMEGAKCAHVEAMILCRQYDAALKACSLLLPTSLNTVYLKAEAQWRGGRPGDALQTLRAAGIAEGAAGKCAQLASFLKQLMASIEAGDAAADAESGIAAFGGVLAMERLKGTHMQALVLRRRAKMHEKRSDFAAALADLDASIALNTNDVDALLHRAGVHREAGDFTSCFLDVRAVRIMDPQRPGAFQAEQAAAQAARRHSSRAHSNSAKHGPSSDADACNLPRSYQVLGVGLSATQRDFTRQYRKLASKWHPDKWATATAEEQKLAEHRFRVVAEAYNTLRDPELRAKHDRDFFFTSRS